MEISRIFVPRTELKDPNKGLASQFLYAEVVLIEQNPHVVHPFFIPTEKCSANAF